MSALVVMKINRKLCVVEDDTGRIVYSHPGFLDPVRDREVMRRLAADIEASDNPIVPIMAHETAHNPRVRRARRAGWSPEADRLSMPGPR